MSRTIPVKQDSFLGGINRQYNPSKIGDNEYPLLVNGRVRQDLVETIQLPLELTSQLPSGNYQGLYAVGTYLVAIVSGKAYYKDVSGSGSGFTLVSGGMQLDAVVANIYGELIPASTINFKRSLVSSANVKGLVNFSDQISPSPNGFLVMDGINQPWIIFQDGTSRVTQNYSQWTPDNREYVPIATYPMFGDGNSINYCIGKDGQGKLNQILRSVSGRPVDYMIAIDTLGDKTQDSTKGDAASVCYIADFNNLTAIAKINSTDNSFFVATASNSYLVFPDTSSTIFAEPTFKKQFLFNTGPLNQFCVVEVLGDTLLIDRKGIVSFNAAQQTKFRGNNTPFSARINSMFEFKPNQYVNQTVACTAKLNNYVYFACNTIYGPAILVYDELMQKFISIDLWSLGDGVFIKQFAVVDTATQSRLFFITTNNRIYEAFASSDTALCQIYIGEWGAQSHVGQLKVDGVQCLFSDIQANGVASVELFVDRLSCDIVLQDLITNVVIQDPPITPPFGFNPGEQASNPLSFGFDDTSKYGKQCGVLVSWSVKASLHEVILVTEDTSVVTSNIQEVQDQTT